MSEKFRRSFVLLNRLTAAGGRKILGIFILILLLLPFQLSLMANAAQKLPVLELSTLNEQSFQTFLKGLRESGYASRVIREDDFVFNITPQNAPYVIVPLSKQVSERVLGVLSRYVNGGGKLILVPPEEYYDMSVNRLFQVLDIQVSGTAFAGESLPMRWKGMSEPKGVGPLLTELPAGSNILSITPSPSMEVLATWGNDYPALVRTSKGLVLNWQWGKQLSPEANAMALSRAANLPMTNLGAVIASESQNSDTKSLDPKSMVPLPVAKAALPRQIISQTQKPVQKAPVEPSYEPNPKMAVSPASAPETSSKPSPTFKPLTHAPSKPAASPSKSVMAVQPSNAPKAGEATTKAEDEVLGNILGTTPEPQDGAVKNEAAQQAAPKQQKHFSFLDPGAEEVLAPEFDYGVYSYNMRVLDGYKLKIQEALDTAKQLSTPLPLDKIHALLREVQNHKRQFETLYLNNETQKGLNAYGEARRLVLQALALATDSPKVEGRAIWLDRSTIIEAGNPAGMKKLMEKLHRAGINIVYFETINAGFPIYPSKLIKNNPLVQGWDPLETAVTEGHRLGMEVHAWVWVFAVGNRRHNPLIGMPDDYAGPILVEGGLMSEALRNASGGLMVDRRQNEFWLSPASPKAREFLLNVYKEILANYKVDGLHLDYIRYPFQASSTRMGYEPVSRERFASSTGLSLGGLDDHGSRVWIAWKTYQVSSFVQQISETLKKIKPDLKISAAVFPMRRNQRIVAIQQDWETWVDNGWVDTLSPMSYTSDSERLQGMFEYVLSSPQKHALVYPGVALHRMDSGRLMLQLTALREKGSLGATLFAGAHLDGEKVEALGTGPFKLSSTLTPHRDVIQSLQTMLGDYQEKFAKLQTEGALSLLPAPQMSSIQTGIKEMSQTLETVGSAKLVTSIPAPQVQQLSQQFRGLKASTSAWVDLDRAANPLRAHYFEKLMHKMESLVGYVADKSGGPVTAVAQPNLAMPEISGEDGKVPTSADEAFDADAPADASQK